MTYRMNQWLSNAAWFGLLATMGSACTGVPIDFTSGSAGTGGDSVGGGAGEGDGAGVGGNPGSGGASASGGTGAVTPAAGTGGAGGKGGTGGGKSGTGGNGSGGTDTPPGTGGALGGTGGALIGAAGATDGDAGESSTGPYAPRSGSFGVLVYSKTSGYRHTGAISDGTLMLMDMGAKQGFGVTFTEDPGAFTSENLAQYEVVFGLNPTGNNLSLAQKTAFEQWMTTKDGAFAGVHAATDHENGWPFYSEVTGQYHDHHDVCCTLQNVEWDSTATDFIAVAGLPNPWPRTEEWFRFDRAAEWSTKPGFKILGRVTTVGGGTRPVSYVREWGNFRSFYTSLGHDRTTYGDTDFVTHVAAGIMWAARREALFVP
jgi:type 1 glutamine amidotransferase